MLRSFAIPLRGFDLVSGHTLTVVVAVTEVALSLGITRFRLRFGFLELLAVSLGLLHVTDGKHKPEQPLALGKSLLRSFAIPLYGCNCVFGHTITLFVAVTNVVLGGGKSLLRSFAIPFHGFDCVLGHAKTVVIAVAEPALTRGESFLRSFP